MATNGPQTPVGDRWSQRQGAQPAHLACTSPGAAPRRSSFRPTAHLCGSHLQCVLLTDMGKAWSPVPVNQENLSSASVPITECSSPSSTRTPSALLNPLGTALSPCHPHGDAVDKRGPSSISCSSRLSCTPPPARTAGHHGGHLFPVPFLQDGTNLKKHPHGDSVQARS